MKFSCKIGSMNPESVISTEELLKAIAYRSAESIYLQDSPRPKKAKEAKEEKVVANEETPTDIEMTGQTIETTTFNYVVAAYGPDGKRFSMNKDFRVMAKQGKTPHEPVFYRSTETVIRNVEEISADDWWDAYSSGKLTVKE